MARKNLAKTSQSRVFLIEDRAGPANVPQYLTLARAQAPNRDFGDITPIRVPDPNTYGKFIVVDKIRGAAGLPTLTLQARYTRDLSVLLALGEKGCSNDIQVHMGTCQDASDFDQGYDKALILEDAQVQSWGADDLGALDQSEDAVINENVPFTGSDLYEVKPIKAGYIGAGIGAIAALAMCDTRACGECGRSSDGCQRIFALTNAGAGSPAVGPTLAWSTDGGSTFTESDISSMGNGEVATGIFCSGNLIVAISPTGLHYANIEDLLTGDETWTLNDAGLDLTNGDPVAGVSLGRTFNWVVGNGGFVYFYDDVTAAATTQTDGSVTPEDLKAISAVDETHLVAVGDAGAVIATETGDTWTLADGYTDVDNLTAVAMVSEVTWFVGNSAGELFYTNDTGVNWTEKSYPQAGSNLTSISFARQSVGYFASNGKIYRTINGGQTWVRVTQPTNAAITHVVACGTKPNVMFGGGSSVDGNLVKAA